MTPLVSGQVSVNRTLRLLATICQILQTADGARGEFVQCQEPERVAAWRMVMKLLDERRQTF